MLQPGFDGVRGLANNGVVSFYRFHMSGFGNIDSACHEPGTVGMD